MPSASLIRTMSMTRLPAGTARLPAVGVIGAGHGRGQDLGPGQEALAAQVLRQAHDHREVAIHLGVRDERPARPARHTPDDAAVGQHGEHLPQRRAAD